MGQIILYNTYMNTAVNLYAAGQIERAKLMLVTAATVAPTLHAVQWTRYCYEAIR